MCWTTWLQPGDYRSGKCGYSGPHSQPEGRNNVNAITFTFFRSWIFGSGSPPYLESVAW